jgi:ATP-dependent Clp protease protease subunit
LVQSTGGFVGDGIAIYNYLRNVPIEIIAYNGGMVSSIAVLVFISR